MEEQAQAMPVSLLIIKAKKCSISFLVAHYNMECFFPLRNAVLEHRISEIIDNLIDLTFEEVKNRRLNHIISHEMPEDYLKYIGNVSMLLHSHREPNNTKLFTKTITEPAESDSLQLHHPSPLRRIHKASQIEEDQLSNMSKIVRKQSMCLSHRSRMSMERQPSRMNIASRRKLLDNRLIPLNRATECSNQVYEEKITQLRKRKIKLQQAMRAFREQDKPEKPIQHKKNKQNNLQFTTDFKGKIINFNPKIAKLKSNENIPYIIKFETLVESGRSWTNWGKVSSNTRRNLFTRELTNDRGVSEAELG